MSAAPLWPGLRVAIRALLPEGAALLSALRFEEGSFWRGAQRFRADPVDLLLVRTLMQHEAVDAGAYAVGAQDFGAVLALLRQHSPACRYVESERVARIEILAAPPDVILELLPAETGPGPREAPAISARAHFQCPETGRPLGEPITRTTAYWTFGDCITPPPAPLEDPTLRIVILGEAGRVFRGPQALELVRRASIAARNGGLSVHLAEGLQALNVAVEPLRARTKVRFDDEGRLCVSAELLTPEGTVVPPEALAAQCEGWVRVGGRAFRAPELTSGATPQQARQLTGDAIAGFLKENLPRLRAAGAEVAPEVEAARVYEGVRPAVAIAISDGDGTALRAQWFFEPTREAGGAVDGGRAGSSSDSAAKRLTPVELLAAAARGQRYLRRGNVFVRVEREAVTAARRELGGIATLREGAGEVRDEEIPELLAWARQAAAHVQTPWNVYVAEAVAGSYKVQDEAAALRLQWDVEERGADTWFAFDAAFECGGEVLTEEELRKLVSQGRKWFRKGNTWIKVDRAALRKFERDAQKSGALRCLGRGGRARYRCRAAERERVTEIFSVAGTAVHADRYRRFLDQLRGFARVESAPVPGGMRMALRPYQRQGYEWLAFLARYGLNGILADDMGLGKTAQTLAVLARLKEQHGPAPALVVTPTSLTDNWRAEARKFSPGLRVMAYRGSPRQRDRLRRAAHEYDLVLGTYATVRNDVSLLRGIEWRHVILDEAHFIKNSAAATTKALKTIPAQHRLALTGTPVQNRLAELWSLFDFLMPGFLGRQAAFREWCEEPVTRLQAGLAKTDDERQRGEQALEDLRERIRPFILRRLKADVASELPPKIENDIVCTLSPEQVALYRGFADTAEARGAVHELETKGPQRARTAILAALMALRKICNHADLMCLPKNAGRQHIAVPLPGYERRSGKFDAVAELLQQCREGGHRALLFCQLTTMLDLLGHFLTRNSIAWARLDGETPAAERQALVERFNTDRALDAFLISTRAGGTGLNLTGADTVIFYDHDWNPANDQQAQDRAHRIGQQRTVNVYRLVCKGTFEERILRRQELKKMLAASVVPEGAEGIATLTREDLLSLFTLSEEEQRK